ncbi:cyclic nucleotide-binding domain-containing protein [Anaerolineales bacterium HSG24]|nr:cyclic nucleotide-binding domain-containing protein [Anaerolineales bacterium HSG24]
MDSGQTLFEFCLTYFEQFKQEFASYNVRTDPAMELREGEGLLCYYDLKDGHIYLSLPDLSNPVGKLQLLFIRSVLGCETNDEVLYFLRLLLPRVIAHEMAHHFRHRYGLFSNNLWQEEQIANQLATAVTKQRLSTVEREDARKFLERSIAILEAKLEVDQEGMDSYYSIWDALSVGGEIGDVALGYMELAHELFSIQPAEILDSGGQLSADISQRLEHREQVIDEINTEYASNFMRYLYYQLSWLYLDLSTRENHYVETFARKWLDVYTPMLPLLSDVDLPSEEAILAVFKAYLDVSHYSEAGAHYFYKRYRALLLTRLQSVELSLPGQAERLKKESAFLLQNWNGDEKGSDMLEYLSHIAPPALRRLFPNQIREQIQRQFPIQIHLPTDTDRRLWRHIVLQEDDQGAANTLSRLNILDKIEIYKALPAEVLLELAYNFCRVKTSSHEPVIWQGEINNDVYILISGRLEAFVTNDGQERLLGKILPGEVFGEMAFFTHEPRNATVRAVEPSECFVLKDSDLHLFSFKYPSIIMQMARILTRRLRGNSPILADEVNLRPVFFDAMQG